MRGKTEPDGLSWPLAIGAPCIHFACAFVNPTRFVDAEPDLPSRASQPASIIPASIPASPASSRSPLVGPSASDSGRTSQHAPMCLAISDPQSHGHAPVVAPNASAPHPADPVHNSPLEAAASPPPPIQSQPDQPPSTGTRPVRIHKPPRPIQPIYRPPLPEQRKKPSKAKPTSRSAKPRTMVESLESTGLSGDVCPCVSSVDIMPH